MIEYYERKIRLKDVEVWNVKIDGQLYTLVIVDEFRPATIDDFAIPDLIYDEEDQRANYVSATYFSYESVKDSHRERLAEFAHMLTDHIALAHCDVIIKFYRECPEQAVKRIMLQRYGYTENDIPLERLKHFNQD